MATITINNITPAGSQAANDIGASAGADTGGKIRTLANVEDGADVTDEGNVTAIANNTAEVTDAPDHIWGLVGGALKRWTKAGFEALTAKRTKMPNGATAAYVEDLWLNTTGWAASAGALSKDTIPGSLLFTASGAGAYCYYSTGGFAGNTMLLRYKSTKSVEISYSSAGGAIGTLPASTTYAMAKFVMPAPSAGAGLPIFTLSSSVNGDTFEIEWIWIGAYAYTEGSFSEEAMRTGNLFADSLGSTPADKIKNLVGAASTTNSGIVPLAVNNTPTALAAVQGNDTRLMPSDFELNMVHSAKKFLDLGGTLISATFGAEDQALRLPIRFTGTLAVTIRAKLSNVHKAQGTYFAPFSFTDAANSTLRAYFRFMRNARITQLDGAGWGWSVAQSAFNAHVFAPTDAGTAFTLASSSSDLMPNRGDVIPMTNGDAFSIRFTGDTSQAANQDIVIQLTATVLRIYHTGDNSTIFTTTLADHGDSVATLCTYLAANLPAGYELKVFSGAGLISELTQFTYAKLVQNKTDDASATFYTDYPVFVQYNDNTEHEYTFVFDANKNWIKFFYDDTENHIAVPGMSAVLTALIGQLIYFNLNCFSSATGYYTGTAQTQNVAVTNIKVSSDISPWLGKRHLVAGAHELGVSATEYTTGVMTSTARLERLFKALSAAGYTPLGIDQLQDYLINGTPIPKRTFSMIFDDNQYNMFTDTVIRGVFTKWGQKPGTGTIYSGHGTVAPDVLAGMDRLGWGSVIHHGYDHAIHYHTITYEAMVAEIEAMITAADALNHPSTMWVLPFGSADNETNKLMLSCGLKILARDAPNYTTASYTESPSYGRGYAFRRIPIQDTTDFAQVLLMINKPDSYLA